MLVSAAGLAAAVLTGAPAAHAEYPAPAPYIGVFGGGHLVMRNWDLGRTGVESQRPKDASAMIGARLGVQIFRQLAFEGEFGYLPVTSTMGGSNTVYSYSLNAYYQLLASDWTPYVGGGVGAFHNTASGDLGSDTDQRTHVALGLRGLVTPWMALRVEAREVITDGFGNGGAHLLEGHAGLDFFLSTAKKEPADRDHDGIVDTEDQCPDEAGPKETQGCPDKDKDGIIDAKDKCPDVAGTAEFDGCPDTDGDGIADPDDKCPKEAGTKENHGCPDLDKDKDGVLDADDKCPDVPGPKETQGCPDKDGDGIADADDKCPDVAGPKETDGCPDRDKDGVIDSEDKCPDVAGPKETQGCPDKDGDGVVDSEDKCPDTPGLKEFQGCMPAAAKKFTGAIAGIYFDTGKSEVKPASFRVLDEAVAVLKKYESLRLRIEGHTDNVGAPEMNKQLSLDRANAVRTYLVNKGIAEDRLEAAGFGDTRPTKPNTTVAGRAANRRIEFVPIMSK